MNRKDSRPAIYEQKGLNDWPYMYRKESRLVIYVQKGIKTGHICTERIHDWPYMNRIEMKMQVCEQKSDSAILIESQNWEYNTHSSESLSNTLH